MKRLKTILMLPVGIALIASCSESGECRALIEEVTESTIVASVDGAKKTFDTSRTLYTAGAVMAGDSAVIAYEGRKPYAVTIELLPQEGTIVDLDELRENGNELITKPVE